MTDQLARRENARQENARPENARREMHVSVLLKMQDLKLLEILREP